MPECVALIRGINVGKAKRLAMQDLRELVESLGASRVRTLLNSGNVVFQAPNSGVRSIARSIEAGITRKFGFSAAVVMLTASELNEIVSDNPLLAVAREPARHLVAFVSDAASLAKARPLLARSWAPEAFAIGSRAAYLWCPGGSIESKLLQAFSRAVGEGATTRNWATVLKLQQTTLRDDQGGRMK